MEDILKEFLAETSDQMEAFTNVSRYFFLKTEPNPILFGTSS